MGNTCPSFSNFFSSTGKEVVQTSTGASVGQHPSTIHVKGRRLNVDCVIGEGGYGFVYLAHSPGDGNQRFAVKRFLITDDESQRKAAHEVAVHSNISPHDCIVKFVDSEVVAIPPKPGSSVISEMFLLMEVADGTLRTAMERQLQDRQAQGPVFPPRQIGDILCACIKALAHMHSQNPPVANWDVKIENVLIFGDVKNLDRCTFKLCDFGSASKQSIRCRNGQQVNRASVLLDDSMTMLYRSPESLDLWAKQLVDTKCDIWALGVLLFTMLCRQMPFDENVRMIQERAFSSPIPDAIQSSTDPQVAALLKLLLNGLLVVDPEQRMNIFQVSEAVHSIFPDVPGLPIVPPEPAVEMPGLFDPMAAPVVEAQ